ncbi:MAG: ATP-binding protein [Planctomycetes bacterium]|nr:ATP-binding protein [Planctomycetota bacterium]NUQ34901.1 PAS domain-containing protein [Planctomycetaceae bacterium]
MARSRFFWTLYFGCLLLVVIATIAAILLVAPASGARAFVVALAIIAIAAVFAFVFAARIARKFERPLEELASAAQAIADGDYTREARSGGGGETAKLAEALNRMAKLVRERMDTIGKERNQVLAILSSMVEGVIAVDAEQHVVHMNKAAASILGTNIETCAGKPVWEVVRISAINEATDQVMQDGKESTGETRITTAAGLERVIEIHAAPLRDTQGGTAGAVVVLFDLTELRRLEAVRRDFVANVSHELKTPLAAIRGLVETLLDDPVMPSHTRTRFLEKARSQTNRLTNIVSDLLTLSRIESQDDGLERASVDLRRIVLDVVRLLGADAEGKNIKLEAILPEQQRANVLGDDEGLRQAVSNLIVNAIKYTPEGGTVSVRLACDNGQARLEVEDTGIGIEQKHLGRIFERFYRVDKARSRDLGGTGLGLSIVKHVATSAGGSVDVRSVFGKGSTFSIQLPLDTNGD